MIVYYTSILILMLMLILILIYYKQPVAYLLYVLITVVRTIRMAILSLLQHNNNNKHNINNTKKQRAVWTKCAIMSFGYATVIEILYSPFYSYDIELSLTSLNVIITRITYLPTESCLDEVSCIYYDRVMAFTLIMTMTA
jgi:cobalamin synthase